jgi:beta-aspartyl-dipeptidase (metallo-type)
MERAMDLTNVGFKLLKNADIYAPKSLGKKDVLICGAKIVAIEDAIDASTIPSCEVIDVAGKKLCPGIIDQHVHLIGGGGEAGPATRAPEVRLSVLVEAGVTTVLGLLGTDGITRHPETLLAKTRALNIEGITAYMLTGAYNVPSPTMTGSIDKDIVYIDPVIGVKIAVSDHRSSAPSIDELTRMATQARVAGMLSGKVGIMVFHMGNSPKMLKPLYDILENSDVPINKLLPTHVNRKEELFEDCIKFALKGGTIDITAGIPTPIAPHEAVDKAIKAGVALERITISSDGNGSSPNFDADGKLISYGVAGFETLLASLQDMVNVSGLSLSEALMPLTSNVARFLMLEEKGEIAVNKDADIMILDDALTITQVYAKGRRMVDNGKACVKGFFE